MKFTFSLIVSLLFSLSTYSGPGRLAEDFSKNFYVKAGFLELSLGYQSVLSKKYSWAVEMDYRPAFGNEASVVNNWLSLSTAMNSARVKLLFNNHVSSSGYWSYFLSYRYLEAEQLSHRSAWIDNLVSSAERGEVFSQVNNEVGLGIVWNKSFRPGSRFEWYVGGGVIGKFIDQQYILDSSDGDYYYPSTREATSRLSVQLAFSAGVKYSFIQF